MMCTACGDTGILIEERAPGMYRMTKCSCGIERCPDEEIDRLLAEIAKRRKIRKVAVNE